MSSFTAALSRNQRLVKQALAGEEYAEALDELPVAQTPKELEQLVTHLGWMHHLASFQVNPTFSNELVGHLGRLCQEAREEVKIMCSSESQARLLRSELSRMVIRGRVLTPKALDLVNSFLHHIPEPTRDAPGHFTILEEYKWFRPNGVPFIWLWATHTGECFERGF